MSGIYKYTILTDQSLILQYHQGDLELDGLIQLKRRMVADPAFDPTYGCITDLRHATVQLSLDDVFHLLEFFEELYKGYPRTQHSLVNNQPLGTALSLLFANENRNRSKAYHVCSSYESALEWLGMTKELATLVEEEFGIMYESMRLE